MMATLVGLKMYSSSTEKTKKMSSKQKFIFYFGSWLIIIPSIYSAFIMVQDTYREKSLQQFVSKELATHYVFDQAINKQNKTITLKVVGDNFKKTEIEKLKEKLANYNLKNYNLNIQQLSNQKYLTAQDLSKY